MCRNTGRCRELLVPGATVYLEKSSNPNRKTAYDLVTVETPFGLVNMDAAAPNQVAGELLRAGAILSSPTLVQPEVRFGASRLDFYAENDRQRLFVEVKGVTLRQGEWAVFPDAPLFGAPSTWESWCRRWRRATVPWRFLLCRWAGAPHSDPTGRRIRLFAGHCLTPKLPV